VYINDNTDDNANDYQLGLHCLTQALFMPSICPMCILKVNTQVLHSGYNPHKH
jgi:hypothetical protein